MNARLARRFLGVAALLALLVPLTLGVEAWQVERVRADKDTRAAAVVADAQQTLQARTTAVMADLHAEAERLARDPAVLRVLADTTAPAPTTDAAVLARSRTRRAEQAIEVYRNDGALMAWDGFTAPFGTAARRGLPDSLRTGIVLDGVERRILVLWLPIRDAGGQQLGAVRAMRLAQVEVPVRNRYLQDYDLAELWRGDIMPPFAVAFTGRRRVFRGDPAPLTGPDGTILGWAQVVLPSEALLVAEVRGQARSIMAFWLVLLGGWLLAGCWAVLNHALRRAIWGRGGLAWWRAGAVLVGWVGVWSGARFGLLALEVPARWVERGGFASSLFDPAYLGSSVLWGLLQSAGDLLLTAIWMVGLAAVALRFALLRTAAARLHEPAPSARLRALVGLIGLVVGALGIVTLFVVGARHAILDATLGYFDRSGPMPEPLTVLVFASLLGWAGATVALVAAAVLLARVRMHLGPSPTSRVWKGVFGLLGTAFVLIYASVPLAAVPPWVAGVMIGVAGSGVALFVLSRPKRWVGLLTIRGLLVCVLLVVPLTYLVLFPAAQERRDALMVETANDFAEGEDRRVIYAMEQIMAEALSDELQPLLAAAVEAHRAGTIVPSDTTAFDEPVVGVDTLQATLDALVGDLVSGSLLASLADYFVRLDLVGPESDTLASYVDPVPEEREPVSPRAGKADPLNVDTLRVRAAERDADGIYLRRAPVERRRGTYRYAGIGPIAPDSIPVAWVYVQAVPRLQRYVAETPFPRVLVPAGLFGEDDEDFSYAEYDNGVLVRSRGDVSGPSRLTSAVRRVFVDDAPAAWVRERIGDQTYRSYYRRLPVSKGGRLDVVAVRSVAAAYYDHLFFLLRLTVAGLLLGFLVYLLGIPIRRGLGVLPNSQSRFRDKVLTRFLIVGIASVALTGVIGRQVIVEQNRQSVRDVLQQRLQRAETEITTEVGTGISVATLLKEIRADQLSAQLGVDLHVFLGPRLISTSRPQLVRQRLIAPRLPAEVYRTLFVANQRYAFDREQIGSFGYTTGYQAIIDEAGRPIGAIAVPTLPEQAAIEAEQARMIAYLFGALLVLLVGIFVTTALLANQLTRPLRRLRAGLQAVGAGQVHEPIPIETHDEMGALAETFNRMQAQLAESQQKLAQQERELAWREMARQVAHEIKNPLTPMKLSVQQLRRSYRAPGEDATPQERKFAGALERISTTLIEQIDALNRIAGEFSAFARLPRRSPELLELSAVVREAAALFEDEAGAGGALPVELRLELAATPLLVEADHEELRRAFINLFKNALQAMPDERRGHITARTWRTNDGCAYAMVEDTGLGIPEEIQENIFQPNFSTKTSGMGLGLAITQKAIEASGGTIGFVTTEGEGTAFTIRLPLMENGASPSSS